MFSRAGLVLATLLLSLGLLCWDVVSLSLSVWCEVSPAMVGSEKLAKTLAVTLPEYWIVCCGLGWLLRKEKGAERLPPVAETPVSLQLLLGGGQPNGLHKKGWALRKSWFLGLGSLGPWK